MNDTVNESGSVGMDMEAPDPVAPATPAPTDPTAPAGNPLQSQVISDGTPPPDEDDAAIDESAIELEHQGQKAKLVPEGAVKAVRTKLKNKVAAAETRASENLSRAERAEQANQQLLQTVQALQNNPALANRVAALAPDTASADDAKYEPIARAMELYDASGKPDIKRAKQIGAFIRAEAETIAESRVAPLIHQTATDRASSHRQTLDQQVAAGRYTKEVLDAVTSALPPEVLASPQAAYIAHLTALGMQQELNAKAGIVTPQAPRAPAPTPPSAQSAPIVIVTESPTRRPAFVEPDGMLAYVMREKGIKPADAQKILGDGPSASIALE